MIPRPLDLFQTFPFLHFIFAINGELSAQAPSTEPTEPKYKVNRSLFSSFHFRPISRYSFCLPPTTKSCLQLRALREANMASALDYDPASHVVLVCLHPVSTALLDRDIYQLLSGPGAEHGEVERRGAYTLLRLSRLLPRRARQGTLCMSILSWYWEWEGILEGGGKGDEAIGRGLGCARG